MYLKRMSSPSCDGDAVTLQALCDALKISVRIVKPVNADIYNKHQQTERLCSSLSENTFNEGKRDTTSLFFESPYPSLSDVVHMRNKRQDGKGQHTLRLYISEEILPRQLSCVDSRIREVQEVVCGRLVWLSHIGDETHYRFLRPAPIPCFEHSSTLKHSFRCHRLEPVNEKEATIAQISRVNRHNRLRDSSSLEDGYVQLLEEESKSGSNNAKKRKRVTF